MPFTFKYSHEIEDAGLVALSCLPYAIGPIASVFLSCLNDNLINKLNYWLKHYKKCGMASLSAAIGQENSVGSAGGITVALLVLAKVGAAVLIVHTVLKGILCRHGLRLIVAMRLGVAITSRVANLMMKIQLS